MFKKLALSLILLTSIEANSTTSKVEVNAKEVVSKGDFIYARDGVEVFYQNSLIYATKAIYNKKSKILKLLGRVELIANNGLREDAKSITIDLNSSDIEFKELFLVSSNDIWISSSKAKKSSNIYTVGKSTLSSCEISKPIWKMAFDKAVYDKTKEYMKLYDTTVYLLDKPIFYTPYLAFSTNNQRSSGFLFPLFGYSKDEGVVYEQPIFWAIAPNVDIEFNPQVRTKRSYGGYATLRFADSANSNGALRVGYFRDKSSYADEHKDNDDSHYGFEFEYDSSELFSSYLSDRYSDGLYINAIYLNDIDYLNLQKTSFSNFGQTPLQESKLNYYIQNNDYYFGLNAKYFIDTRDDVEQDKTLQILPSLSLHKYISKLFIDNLTYSVDMGYSNFYRKDGVNLDDVTIHIPVEYTLTMFDEYLGLSIGEDFYYTKLFYSRGDFEYDRFQNISGFHYLKLFSDLTKSYENYTHTIQPSLEYIDSTFSDNSPVAISSLTPEQRELFNLCDTQEHFKLSFGQYFYDDKMNLKFYQRLSQIYYKNRTATRDYRWADLENEMRYEMGRWSFYNEMKYSYHFSKIRESSSRITYSDNQLEFSLWHTYRDILGDEDRDDLDKANEISFDFDYRYDTHWNFNGALSYNLDNSSSKQWSIGAKYQQDCWDISLKLKQEIIPRPDGSDTQNSFYLMMNFKPFATLGASL